MENNEEYWYWQGRREGIATANKRNLKSLKEFMKKLKTESTKGDNHGENDNLKFEMEKAIANLQGDSAFRMDKKRPYNGQDHTSQGKRGETLIKGLTMRDISDCIVRGFLSSGNMGGLKNPIHDDLYRINKELDYGAVIQNALCHVERMMGIYPNVPKLTHIES